VRARVCARVCVCVCNSFPCYLVVSLFPVLSIQFLDHLLILYAAATLALRSNERMLI
jgi:hypothetical protein